MSQTAYDGYMDEAIKGQPADGNDPNNDIVTYNNPVDRIMFGLGLAKVSGDDNGCEIPSGGGFDFIGCAVRGMNVPSYDYYEVKDAVPVMKKGRMWVLCEVDCDPDDSVFLVHTGATAGQFRNDATNADAVPNARFMNSTITTDGGEKITIVDLNVT
jgi:hypothetical protein